MSESTAHGRQLLKEKICLTALRLFHKRGIRQVKMDDIVRIIKDQTVFYQQYGIKTVWTTLVRVFLRSICTLKGVQELDAFLDKMATEDGAFSPV